MIYAFVDTNILIRVLSQGKPGCEFELFEDLRALAAGNAFQLLVPDVVRFELDRQMRDLPRELRARFGQLKASVNQTSVWSEIADAKESILQQLDSLRETKKQGWHDRFANVDAFLRSDHVTRLAYTPDIMCRARIRLMRGSKLNKDQDAAIIESLAEFFETCTDNHPVLLFCSENHTDFAVELDPGPDRSRRFAIDPDIACVLPQIYYFLRLDELLKIDQGYESLPKSPEGEEIAQAMGRISELEDEGYDDTDEYLAAVEEVEAFYDRRLSQEFLANIRPHLPEELRKRRDEACDHIEEMLRKCRGCPSWDDVKSESKLPQWLEYVPEHMIRYTTLAKILRIEESIKRYLRIHEAADNDQNDR